MQACNILKNEFQGDAKAIVVKVKSLRREFETLQMKNDESVSEFLSKTIDVVNYMRTSSVDIKYQSVMEKILRCLNFKFDHVVVSIEESKDLIVFSFDELMRSLQAHEVQINRTNENTEERLYKFMIRISVVVVVIMVVVRKISMVVYVDDL